MESAHIAGGTLCINRERGNSLKCKLRNCRMRNSSIHCRCRWLLLCKCRVSYCFVFLLFVIAKIATISIFPKIILLSLIKIAGCSLKIAIRHPKISGLKIAVHSLKIAGLKIIARMWARMWARMCVRSLFCEPRQNITGCNQSRTEHKRPERPPANAGTQATATSTRVGTQAAPQAPEHAHPIRKRKLKNNSKLIFF